MHTHIFEPFELAGIRLNNRIIRSATNEGMTDEQGRPTEQLQKLYVRLAKGGVGAIITGYAGIHQQGKSPLYRMLMIDTDQHIAAYQALVDAVHARQTPIILQIAHCGRQTRSKVTGLPTVAPSAIRDRIYSEDLPHALTETEIEQIIQNFVNAIRRAKQAGFDGVQLHAAHGYLLAEFLSPYMNRRTDQWGGSTENRFRIIREIYQRARQIVGDYPIWIKLNAHDNRKNGMRIEEAIVIARLLEQAGCSAIEVSCGVMEDGFYAARGPQIPIDALFAYNAIFKKFPKMTKPVVQFVSRLLMPPAQPLTQYNVPAAQAIKAQVNIPVIVVGGIHTLPDITAVLEQGHADAVSMCRPLIMEPNLVQKFREGKQTAARCTMCNYCVIAQEAEPLRCYNGNLRVR
jgi:2,4-dienoyl-CoA reductase-like NADH-dependent reductase (Old Yellow Enzyme family)